MGLIGGDGPHVHVKRDEFRTWEATTEELVAENRELWEEMSRLPDHFIPLWLWALVLVLALAAIIGWLT